MTYLKLFRVKHYIKNFYVFMPAFFSGRILEGDIALNSGIAFLQFSLIASSIYIINDLGDIEEDRLHPTKRFRPIPSGQVSRNTALILAILSALVSFSSAWFFEGNLFWILLAYFVMNIAYSSGLKHVAILDISLVSLGFILRISAGEAATGIPISKWLMMMVFILSMFQAMAKRLDDIFVAESEGVVSRKSIGGYNADFLKIALSIFSAVLLVCYLIYITQPTIIERLGENSYFTLLPVLLGVMRYLQQLYVYKLSYNPVKIVLRDHFLQAICLLWVASFAYLLYV